MQGAAAVRAWPRAQGRGETPRRVTPGGVASALSPIPEGTSVADERGQPLPTIKTHGQDAVRALACLSVSHDATGGAAALGPDALASLAVPPAAGTEVGQA